MRANVVGPLLNKIELPRENTEKPSSPQSLPVRSAFRNPWSLRTGGRAGARNLYLDRRGSGQAIFKGFYRCI